MGRGRRGGSYRPTGPRCARRAQRAGRRDTEVAGRWRRRPRRQVQVERHPDDLPKRGLFTEPIRITRLDALQPEHIVADVAAGDDVTGDDPSDAAQLRVTFLIEVKDAEDRRCSDLAVDARLEGPERTSVVQGATDMFGRVKVRMVGPPGRYHIEILEVAAKALTYDRAAGPSTASIEVAG